MRALSFGCQKGAGCQFRWLRLVQAASVNKFETCVPAQLKRSFTKRTAYRKQRAIIMSADLEYDHLRRNRPQVSNQRKINSRFVDQVIPRQTQRTQLRRISIQQ